MHPLLYVWPFYAPARRLPSASPGSLGGPLANELIGRINPEAQITTDEARIRPKNSEVERLLGSNAKIMELTGWTPQHSLEKGLAETIEWFRQSPQARAYKHDIYNV